jgi:Icc-related predicted phosphoesterase
MKKKDIIKIISTSDTHGYTFVDKVPKCDILCISGDISPVNMSHGYVTQKSWFESNFISDLKAIKKKARNVVFIAGNHDTYLSEMNISKRNDVIRDMLPKKVHYLCDDLTDIEGIRIYGSPWCNLPVWGDKGPPVWNFAERDIVLNNIYQNMPSDIDILITHGPAYGQCDSICEGSHAGTQYIGSPALRNRLNTSNVRYVLSGHIHSAQRETWVSDGENKRFYSCVSFLNEDYTHNDKYKPVEIDYVR